MKSPRAVCATLVLLGTLAGAAWLYTYRVARVREYVDPLGRHFHPAQRLQEQPWWSVPAAVALTLIGATAYMWLKPGRTRRIRHLVGRLAGPS